MRCTYRGQTPFDEKVQLAAGGTRTIGPFAIGTSCVVSETGSGGATSTALAPADGTVVVPAPDQPGGLSHATVTATNTFRLTSLEVIKKVVGDTTSPVYWILCLVAGAALLAVMAVRLRTPAAVVRVIGSAVAATAVLSLG